MDKREIKKCFYRFLVETGYVELACLENGYWAHKELLL